MRRHWKHALLWSAFVVGVAGSTLITGALASRNSSGTYSLPSGNPVTSGTPISSSWANTTLSDMASEITLSLDRNGRGAMLAPLQCSVGTVAAPGLTFSGDADTGLYRIGANNPGFAAGGVKVQEWTATGSTFPLTLAVTGAQTNAAGITVTQSTTNGNGVTVTGNGTGKGGAFTGGSSNGWGVYATGGAPNGIAFVGDGTGFGEGVFVGSGPTATRAIYGYGHASSTAIGVEGVGAPATAGGKFSNGTNSTGATQQTALELANGNLKLSGTAPNSSVGPSNTLTPSNIIKAWGNASSTGAGAVTVNSGFNVASVVCSGAGNDDYTVTMTTGMASTSSYAIVASTSNAGVSNVNANPLSATQFEVRSTGSACDTTAGSNIQFIVVGLQ